MAEVSDIKPESINGKTMAGQRLSADDKALNRNSPQPNAPKDSRGETPGSSTRVSGSGKNVVPRASVDLSKVPTHVTGGNP